MAIVVGLALLAVSVSGSKQKVVNLEDEDSFDYEEESALQKGDIKVTQSALKAAKIEKHALQSRFDDE